MLVLKFYYIAAWNITGYPLRMLSAIQKIIAQLLYFMIYKLGFFLYKMGFFLDKSLQITFILVTCCQVQDKDFAIFNVILT